MIEIIDPLEKELGVPMISSNTATFGAMMRKVWKAFTGIIKEIKGRIFFELKLKINKEVCYGRNEGISYFTA